MNDDISEFDKLYMAARQKAEEYRDSRKTASARADAKHALAAVTVNYNYFRSVFEARPDQITVCKICGRMDTNTYSAPTGPYMREHSVCFGHALWEERIRNADRATIVINGNLYSDGGESKDRPQFLGHGGRRFYIKKGDHVWTTNNLWSGGPIPEEMQDRLPNNAEFLTKEQYEDHPANGEAK